MPQTLNLQADQKTLEIKEIILINNDTKKHVDLIKLFTSFEINESIENKFYNGSIVINTEYDIREYISMSGKETIRISWSTGEDFLLRTHSFKILNITNQEEVQENVMETIKIDFVDERYLTLLSTEPHKIFSNSSTSTILTTMFNKLKIRTNIETTTEKFNYYWLKPFVDCVNEVRLANNNPLLIFQQNTGIVGKTLKTLFFQTPIKFDYSLIENEDNKRELKYNNIKDISCVNIIDNEDLYDNGFGNKLFTRNYWTKTHSYVDKKLDEAAILRNTNLKFNTTGTIRERVNFSNYQYIEDYFLTDYIEASIPFATSNLMVGLLINISIPSKFDENDYSIRSGDYLIYGINHKIDRNLSYSQNVTLIKKQLFKSIF